MTNESIVKTTREALLDFWKLLNYGSLVIRQFMNELLIFDITFYAIKILNCKEVSKLKLEESTNLFKLVQLILYAIDRKFISKNSNF